MTCGVDILPPRPDLAQEDVQEVLAHFRDSGASLADCLGALRRWSAAVGYFAHLSVPNDFLAFHDDELGLELRLQVNYSRLGYKAPVGGLACPLCIGNVGAPGKELLRVFEFPLAGVPYFSHLTPFPLHPGHFVLNARRHEPMRIGAPALHEAAAFLRETPGWLVASNSDVEWAGASVLGHHHCQVFEQLRLPVQHAAVRLAARLGGVSCELLHWLGPVYRLAGPPSDVLAAGAAMVAHWKGQDPGLCTCNYLMHTQQADLVLHLFLRHPAHRTPQEWRTVKAEGVGIIEVAGEVIVPPLPGLSREENRAWFEANGLRVIRGILSGNAPVGGRWDWDYFESLPGRVG